MQQSTTRYTTVIVALSVKTSTTTTEMIKRSCWQWMCNYISETWWATEKMNLSAEKIIKLSRPLGSMEKSFLAHQALISCCLLPRLGRGRIKPQVRHMIGWTYGLGQGQHVVLREHRGLWLKRNEIIFKHSDWERGQYSCSPPVGLLHSLMDGRMRKQRGKRERHIWGTLKGMLSQT